MLALRPARSAGLRRCAPRPFAGDSGAEKNPTRATGPPLALRSALVVCGRRPGGMPARGSGFEEPGPGGGGAGRPYGHGQGPLPGKGRAGRRRPSRPLQVASDNRSIIRPCPRPAPPWAAPSRGLEHNGAMSTWAGLGVVACGRSGLRRAKSRALVRSRASVACGRGPVTLPALGSKVGTQAAPVGTMVAALASSWARPACRGFVRKRRLLAAHSAAGGVAVLAAGAGAKEEWSDVGREAPPAAGAASLRWCECGASIARVSTTKQSGVTCDVALARARVPPCSQPARLPSAALRAAPAPTRPPRRRSCRLLRAAVCAMCAGDGDGVGSGSGVCSGRRSDSPEPIRFPSPATRSHRSAQTRSRAASRRRPRCCRLASSRGGHP